jgi:hypothetical protein
MEGWRKKDGKSDEKTEGNKININNVAVINPSHLHTVP